VSLVSFLQSPRHSFCVPYEHKWPPPTLATADHLYHAPTLATLTHGNQTQTPHLPSATDPRPTIINNDKMRPTFTQYALLFLFSSMATSQESRSLIIPSSGTSSFPACAVSCAVLTQAQTACQPQATTQLAFENCFCQSPTLAALYSTPDAVCAAECPTESDRTLLQSWYSGFCQKVGQGVDPLTVVAPTTTLVTSTAAAPTPTITKAGTFAASQNETGKDWYASSCILHWSSLLTFV
jgi:hypothetical protein